MSIVKRLFAVLVVALLVVSVKPEITQAASGQNYQPAIPVTLKLTVVIARFTGEKKVGSLPFLLMVVSGSAPDRDGEQTQLQTGARVPVPQTTFTQGGGATTPQTSYTYQQFGTNITASGRGIDANTFSVGLTVTDSQLLSDSPEQAQYAQGVRLPRYQSFTSSNRLILRDGQTVQYTAATDKTSGEVIKLDVTLSVIK